MNVASNPDDAETEILANACVSISERNPAAIIAETRVRQVAILDRGKPVAYVASPEVWDHILEVFSDNKLVREAIEELENSEEGIPLAFDELLD